jgi:hypothetical protein
MDAPAGLPRPGLLAPFRLRDLDCFGNVCQAFSTYEARRGPFDQKPFATGINSIQLLNDGLRWWVASIVWDTERPSNPIPPEYRAN